MIARIMAGQFRKPVGWLGRLVGNRIHCIYFWPQPTAAMQELRRVLKSVVALTILPKERQERTPPADVFTLYSADEEKEVPN